MSKKCTLCNFGQGQVSRHVIYKTNCNTWSLRSLMTKVIRNSPLYSASPILIMDLVKSACGQTRFYFDDSETDGKPEAVAKIYNSAIYHENRSNENNAKFYQLQSNKFCVRRKSKELSFITIILTYFQKIHYPLIMKSY